MNQLYLVPESTIERLKHEDEEHRKHLVEVGYPVESWQRDIRMRRIRQERFLDVYRRCLSPTITCKQTDISLASYRKWRSTDPWFCEQLNDVIEDWRERLMGSALARAVGYLSVDEAGNIVVDAEGKPVYAGASDTLTKALLGLNDTVQVTVLPTVVFDMLGVDPEERPDTVPAHGEVIEHDPAPEHALPDALAREEVPEPAAGAMRSTYNKSVRDGEPEAGR